MTLINAHIETSMLKKDPSNQLKDHGNSTFENWMEQIAPFIADLKINDIMIPGSHDSGCYNSASFLGKPWVKTQNYSITQQLKSGVRYFDLRFAYFEGKIPAFKISHDVWNTDVPLEDVTTALKDFLEKNPKEVVVLKLSHFRDFNDDAHQKFAKYFISDSQLGKFMVQKSPDAIANNNATSNLTMSQMWNLNQRLLVITDNEQLTAIEKESDLISKLWSEDCMTSKWCNTLEVKELEQKCSEVVNADHAFLWALELILTPDTEYVVKNYLTGGSVEKLSEEVNPYVKQWLYQKPDWRNKVNLFVVDFFQSPDWINIAIKANKERLSQKIGNIITSSQNTKSVDEDVLLKTASLFDVMKNTQLIKIAEHIKAKNVQDKTYFEKRLTFYRFLFQSKFKKEQDINIISSLCLAILSNVMQPGCPENVKQAATDDIRELGKTYGINENSIAARIFEQVYRPQLDYKFKAPFIENNNGLNPPSIVSSRKRRREAIEKIKYFCTGNKQEARTLFNSAKNQWLKNKPIDELTQKSAEHLTEKILSRILLLNKKVGLLGGEKITFNKQQLVLPKSAYLMMNKYQEVKSEQPAEFVKYCVEIAHKALARDRGTLFNWRQDETEDFYQWLSKIHLPEEKYDLNPVSAAVY